MIKIEKVSLSYDKRTVLEDISLNLKEKSFIREHYLCTINSTFPPTTSAATTAFLTGKYPIETGWMSWTQYFEEYKKGMEARFGGGSCQVLKIWNGKSNCLCIVCGTETVFLRKGGVFRNPVVRFMRKKTNSRYWPRNCDNSNKDKVGESYRIRSFYSLNLTKNDGRIDSITQRKGEKLC